MKDKSVQTDSLKFAKSLCEYFANIGSKMSQKLLCSDAFPFKIYSKSCMHSFMLHEITPEEVRNCISNIKPYSVSGMNGISPKVVKLARCIFSPCLAKLFNKSLEQELFPIDLKLANVIPIPNTLSPKSLDECCPISLLSVFSKLFEQILKNKMLEFNDKNNILT